MLLEVQHMDISLVTGERKVLCNDLNFSVAPGETVGILGESGSGKSITALSVMNLLPPAIKITRGRILYQMTDGSVTDLTKMPASSLQKVRGKEISMIFQEPMTSLNPVMRCGVQVIEIIRQHLLLSSKEARSYVLELFSKVELDDPERIYHSYPYQLSGGQKQRVMIAMAIACKPRLVIADEPTTALDVTVQKSILRLLKALQQEYGMSIVFITHDISVVAEIADRILIFYKGNLVEEGSVKAILEHAQHPYTRGLMGCRYSMNEKGKRLLTVNDFSGEEGGNRPNKPLAGNHRRDLVNTEEDIFEVRNLRVSFTQPGKFLFGHATEKQIIRNISFTVRRGETLGLVGESGSGKTTIGRALIKLIDARSGDLFFRGKSMINLTPEELRNFRKEVQIIFQDPYSSLNPKLPIGRMIEEPLSVHGLCKSVSERRARVKELLRSVNLDESFMARYPHQLSGGQRQRIGIARALAVDPEMLILDESVAALDVSVQAQILNLLNDLKAAYNLTYLFISHDLNIVRYMSDRIIVLREGEIVEYGNAESVFLNPQHPYTRKLLNSIPGLK